ncbi:MAG: ketoacyl-ACP synthase III [Candidatus Methanofastidiosa archaeon]|jgi:3-oxoacyl-[acyl-carrier-protein] synthase-3|nr:ketoacyl-ACP synthase III [Candidatus Methanofastidiosa archaeon]
MALIKYKNVQIKALSACVPKNINRNADLGYLIPEEEIEKTINSIGIREKRFADKDVCSSDLCFKAAEKLIADNDIERDSIDALIFLSQTPDYHQPATAPNLQHRLGLKESTLSFDVNLACSGYVYGLSIAFSFTSQDGVNRVLFLTGETMSKTISPKDKVTFPLFGDAGTATLIDKVENEVSYFSLNSDGSGADVLNMPYGGYRNPSSVEGFVEQKDKDGNIRTGEHLKMEGMDVFNFGIRVVPRDIKRILNFSEIIIDDVDLIIYHQANKFMTNFFTKKLKFSTDKTPYSLEKFGNTSSASIPLTIVSEMFEKDKYPNRNNVIMAGFGAGLSWGTALLDLSKCEVSELIEY